MLLAVGTLCLMAGCSSKVSSSKGIVSSQKWNKYKNNNKLYKVNKTHKPIKVGIVQCSNYQIQKYYIKKLILFIENFSFEQQEGCTKNKE